MWTFLTAIFGFLMPIRYTGRLLLQHELQQNGIDVRMIPQACLQEFVDEDIAHAKSEAKIGWARQQHWKAQTVDFIEGRAILIAQVIQGVYANEHIAAVLQKHGVRLGSNR
jgi:hypothetical protein